LFTARLLGSTLSFDAHFTALLTTAMVCKTNRAEVVFICKVSAEKFAYLLNKRSQTDRQPSLAWRVYWKLCSNPFSQKSIFARYWYTKDVTCGLLCQ
jgi:hypothetical protein